MGNRKRKGRASATSANIPSSLGRIIRERGRGAKPKGRRSVNQKMKKKGKARQDWFESSFLQGGSPGLGHRG